MKFYRVKLPFGEISQSNRTHSGNRALVHSMNLVTTSHRVRVRTKRLLWVRQKYSAALHLTPCGQHDGFSRMLRCLVVRTVCDFLVPTQTNEPYKYGTATGAAVCSVNGARTYKRSITREECHCSHRGSSCTAVYTGL